LALKLFLNSSTPIFTSECSETGGRALHSSDPLAGFRGWAPGKERERGWTLPVFKRGCTSDV